jgi:hypothetical protein
MNKQEKQVSNKENTKKPLKNNKGWKNLYQSMEKLEDKYPVQITSKKMEKSLFIIKGETK